MHLRNPANPYTEPEPDELAQINTIQLRRMGYSLSEIAEMRDLEKLAALNYGAVLDEHDYTVMAARIAVSLAQALRR